MGKIDIRSVNFEDEDYEIYEKFTKRNRKQNFDEGVLNAHAALYDRPIQTFGY